MTALYEEGCFKGIFLSSKVNMWAKSRTDFTVLLSNTQPQPVALKDLRLQQMFAQPLGLA